MRRGFGFACVTAALLLVVGAGLVKWVAAPALVKAPLSINSVTVSTGTAQLFVLTAQQVQTVPVVATRTVTGDAQRGTDSVAVYDEVLCLRAGNATGADTHGCVLSTDPDFIQKTTDRVAFDRVSALPAVEQASFGAAVDGNGSIVHTGLGYTFPIDTKKKSYPFFDTVVGKSYPMAYAGAEKVNGMSTYKFVQHVPGSPIKINGVLPGTYSNVRTVWVQPTTGVIVKGSEAIDEEFTSNDQTVFRGTLSFDAATVRAQVKFADDQLGKVQLIRKWVPLGLLLLGLMSLVLGNVLLLRGHERPVHRVAAKVDQPSVRSDSQT
ncbi:MAG: DUF3068 domain-containing protein [Actinobacteria bacterium]|nr:DUF3068 domain-containing protein [Actinomycetota bacterium]